MRRGGLIRLSQPCKLACRVKTPIPRQKVRSCRKYHGSIHSNTRASLKTKTCGEFQIDDTTRPASLTNGGSPEHYQALSSNNLNHNT